MGSNGSGLTALLLDHPLRGDDPLLHARDGSVAAGEARARAQTLADELRAIGVGPGQGVAVRLPNGPDAVLAMFGVWLAGAVLVPINPRAPEAERDHLLAATGPVASLDVDGMHRHDGETTARTFDPGTAFVLWTSGTTGRPKPILHTHAGYLELLDRVLGPLRGGAPRDPDRPVSPNLIPVPLALNAGIYNALFGLRAGAPLVIMDGFEPIVFAELVARFAIRSTVLPPASISALTAEPSITDLAPLRYVRSITAPLTPLAATRFTERFGVAVLNGYGQAEIGEVIGWTAADAREHPDKVGAVGRAHPGVAIKVDAPDGPGSVGPLWVKPASMAAGYASADDLADRLDADGFLDTGDLARIDDDGFVWIEGRASDLINRGGNKVFPEQVEEVLELAAGVDEAAVVGRPDERLGEVPVAFLVGAGPTDDELVALCREHLAAYKVPVAFRWIDALPRNEIGKLLRRELLSSARDTEGAR